MGAVHDLIEQTTIVAVATPTGRGGIGVVRLSGADALSIARRLLPKIAEWTPRSALYGLLRDADGERVDDAVAVYYPAPRSYTGEDVVEIAAHGSPVVLDWLLRQCVALGAVPARAGEFTERAFLRGRLDLTEAEAVRDLIDAQTLEQAKLAAEQMGGSIAAEVHPAKEALVMLIAGLEAGIDFAEDDTPTMGAEPIRAAIGRISVPLHALLASFSHGRLLREGLQLAIVGRPNAGKSSLFNRLVERDRAIVTPAAGTTRDVIAERVSIGGVPVELLDTAGIREATDEAERMGVERSRQAMADADAVLLVIDGASVDAVEVNGGAGGDSPVQGSVVDGVSFGPSGDDRCAAGTVTATVGSLDDHCSPHHAKEVAGRAANMDAKRISGWLDADGEMGAALAGRPLLVAWNKADLSGDVAWTAPENAVVVRTSAATGEGIAELRRQILRIAGGDAVSAGGATLTNLRQRDAVASATESLRRAESATLNGTPHEMLLLDLYETLRALDSLTGQTTADDVLHRIFSTFCIGK